MFRRGPQTADEHVWPMSIGGDSRAMRLPVLRPPEPPKGCTRFLHGRAWTSAEEPVGGLFDHAVALMRRGRVLLPEVTVVAWLYQQP